MGGKRIYLAFWFLLLLFLGFLLLRIGKKIREREKVLKDLEKETIFLRVDTLRYGLKKNETIDNILQKVSILSQQERELIRKGLRESGLNFFTLKEGETLLFYQRDSQILSVDYRKDFLRTFRVYLSPLRSAMVYKKRESRLEVVRGAVTSSLYESVLKIGEKPELAVRFAEILEWDIDFWTEVSTGDSFIILTEKVYGGDQFFSYGDLWLAIFKGRVGNYFGVKFGGEYYDLKGRALRRAFLKSPLRFSHISSYFSRARRHPILKIIRPHRGVDYCAPTGTPVSALGDGVVTFAGWCGGYGRLVVIRHPNSYITKYGHLLRIKKGIRVGRRVKQGEVIGYVGSSGLATGPHLHFEVLKDGSWVNPLKIASPPSSPVPPELMAQFQAHTDSLCQILSSLGETTKIKN
ncbi:MAG: M23 family metallopeptidase [candidate division WOR-3 bacterium]